MPGRPARIEAVGGGGAAFGSDTCNGGHGRLRRRAESGRRAGLSSARRLGARQQEKW